MQKPQNMQIQLHNLFAGQRTRTLILAALVWMVTQAAWAQGRAVTGRVTDQGDNSPLPGVTVLVKGTTNGTATGGDGSFSINVPEDNAVLVFSFIGYTNQEVAVGTRSTVDVSLSADVQALSEVVVIGYGTQKKKDVTGSIAQVDSKNFNPGINPNPLQAIQGKVAGLVITQPSGDPNSNPTVRLRGYTSLAGGSDPLYVVDGVIGVPINSVSPDDIETIDVLKDASAAAIYGSRAANGVIIVTTKRGKSGKGTVSFNNYVGMERISRFFDLLNADEYRQEVVRVAGQAPLSDLQRFPEGGPYSTNWLDEISRTGFTNNHDLSVTGGGEQFSYRGSLNYINREGIIKNTGFERVTGRFNLDQRALNDKLRIQYNLSLASTNSDLNQNALISRAITFLPTIPVRRPDGGTEDGGYSEIGGSFSLFNPVAIQNNFETDRIKRVLIGGLNLSYEIFDGFVIGANGAYRNENEVNSFALNSVIKQFANSQGATGRSLGQINNKLLDLTASYTRAFGENNNFNVLGGYSYQENIEDGFNAFNNNYVAGSYDLFGYNNIGAGRGTLLEGRSDYTGSYRNKWVLASFFSRATVNLLDKYNFTATVRRDGSSKFGANYKWGLFPSVAAGWTLSNENFLKGNNILSYAKIRIGWGQTGNSEGIRPYTSIRLVGAARNYYDGAIGNFVPGYDFTQNENPNLKWEVLQTTNLGLDFTLFNKVNGTVEVYDKTTKDMLFNYSVPTTGSSQFVFDRILTNAGTMRNRGVELSLGADVLTRGEFNWNARVVGAYLQNKVVSLTNENFTVGIIRYNSFGGRGLSDVFASQLREGRPYGEFYIPRFAGFADNGDVLLVGKDGGTTTNYGQAELYNAGIAIPPVTAAFINSFRYRNLDLNFQLRGQFGNKILNNIRSNQTIPGSILENNALRDVRNFPANYSTNQISDLWLESGNFVRLDNWQIGYNVPVEGSVFQNARVYLGGNNLFILTKYKGVDPELEVKGDLQEEGRSQRPNNIGLDDGNIYPKTRSFQLGVNLTF
jgi:iron complex outermembrane receptor protein